MPAPPAGLVREFFAGSASCFFAALREEAEARSLAYDPLLEALEAELYDTDAALLPALIDMAAVQRRAAPCGLSVAAQAGIPPSIMATAARAAAR